METSRDKLLNRLRSQRRRWNDKYCELINNGIDYQLIRETNWIDKIDTLISRTSSGENIAQIEAEYQELKARLLEPDCTLASAMGA